MEDYLDNTQIVDMDEMINGKRMRKQISNRYLKSPYPDINPVRMGAYRLLWRPETRLLGTGAFIGSNLYDAIGDPLTPLGWAYRTLQDVPSDALQQNYNRKMEMD